MHPASRDGATWWGQQNGRQRTPAAQHSAWLLLAQTVGGARAAFSPAKSLLRYFPTLEMVKYAPTADQLRQHQFHKKRKFQVV